MSDEELIGKEVITKSGIYGRVVSILKSSIGTKLFLDTGHKVIDRGDIECIFLGCSSPMSGYLHTVLEC